MARRSWSAALLALALAGGAAAQAFQESAASTPAVSTATPTAAWHDLPIWPEPNPIQLSWFAAIAILALTLRARQPLSLASLDGLSLAIAAILFVLRDLDSSHRTAGGHTWSWWALTLFPLIAGYWFVRGLMLFGGARPSRLSRVALGGPVIVFAFVGLLLAGRSVATGLIPPATHDGFVGATGMLESGKLPYGDYPGHDSRSPLLYTFVAGVLKVAQPAALPDDPGGAAAVAPERTIVFPANPPVRYDATALRGANALLVGLATVALFIVGVGCGARSLGVGLAAIFLLFPGVREGFGDTQLLLASTALAWALAFMFVPWCGAIGSALCLTLGGLTCPWLWLGLPLLFAYHLRRGAALIGTVCGLLLGLAAIGYGLANHVRATLPRDDGIMMAADIAPRFVARLSADKQLLQIVADERSSRGKARLVAPLLRRMVEQEDLTLAAACKRQGLPEIILPDGVAPTDVLYSEIAATDEAAEVLQSEYRADLESASEKKRFVAAVRTVLEATWLAPSRRASGESIEPSTWRTWEVDPGQVDGRLDWVRRVVRIAAVACALLLALGLLIRREADFGEFAGALLATLTLAFVASEPGSAARWAWIVPAILAAHAVMRPLENAGPSLPPVEYVPPHAAGPGRVGIDRGEARGGDYVSIAELTRSSGVNPRSTWGEPAPEGPPPPARTPERPRPGPPPYRSSNNPPHAG